MKSKSKTKSDLKLESIPFEQIFQVPMRNGLFKPTKVRGNGTKMINMGEIFAFDRIHDIKMEKVPLTEKEEINSLLEKYDLLFARASLAGDAGKCCIFCGNEPTTFESHVIRVRINKKLADPRFYYYYFNSRLGRNLMNTIVEKTAVSGIRASDLAKLEVISLLPNLQNNIANMLWKIDDFIDDLQHQNQILEKIIQTIFKSWFIDFDGQIEFVDSELGQIPKGWEVGKLGDIAINIKRTVKPFEKNQTHYIGLEHMPRGDKFLSEWGFSDGLLSNKFEFQADQILFGKLRPYFKKIGISPIDGICSTDILVIDSKNPNHLGFVLFVVSSDEFINYTDGSSTGTRMPRTDWETMKMYQIVIPSAESLQRFDKIFQPLCDIIFKNIYRMQLLKKIRDSLLPKLMSGEISV